jgi:hypothetical protein
MSSKSSILLGHGDRGGRDEGEWKNDLQNGRGVMVHDGGGRAHGQWKDGRATVGSSFAECGFR